MNEARQMVFVILTSKSFLSNLQSSSFTTPYNSFVFLRIDPSPRKKKATTPLVLSLRALHLLPLPSPAKPCAPNTGAPAPAARPAAVSEAAAARLRAPNAGAPAHVARAPLSDSGAVATTSLVGVGRRWVDGQRREKKKCYGGYRENESGHRKRELGKASIYSFTVPSTKVKTAYTSLCQKHFFKLAFWYSLNTCFRLWSKLYQTNNKIL